MCVCVGVGVDVDVSPPRQYFSLHIGEKRKIGQPNSALTESTASPYPLINIVKASSPTLPPPDQCEKKMDLISRPSLLDITVASDMRALQKYP